MAGAGLAQHDPIRATIVAWVRALAFFSAIVLGFFFVPQWILTELSGPSRGVRIWLATGWMFAFLAGLGGWAWRSTGTRDAERTPP